MSLKLEQIVCMLMYCYALKTYPLMRKKNNDMLDSLVLCKE